MRLVVCLAILHFSQLLAKTPEHLACKWGMHEMMPILGGISALVSLVITTGSINHAPPRGITAEASKDRAAEQRKDCLGMVWYCNVNWFCQHTFGKVSMTLAPLASSFTVGPSL